MEEINLFNLWASLDDPAITYYEYMQDVLKNGDVVQIGLKFYLLEY
jgi:hypothetical protein